MCQDQIALSLQGCAVVVEAQQLEYGGKADVVISTARGGCFLQDHVMQVYSYLEVSCPIESCVSYVHQGLLTPGVAYSTCYNICRNFWPCCGFLDKYHRRPLHLVCNEIHFQQCYHSYFDSWPVLLTHIVQ